MDEEFEDCTPEFKPSDQNTQQKLIPGHDTVSLKVKPNQASSKIKTVSDASGQRPYSKPMKEFTPNFTVSDSMKYTDFLLQIDE